MHPSQGTTVDYSAFGFVGLFFPVLYTARMMPGYQEIDNHLKVNVSLELFLDYGLVTITKNCLLSVNPLKAYRYQAGKLTFVSKILEIGIY